MKKITSAFITSTFLSLSAQSAMAVEPQEFMERMAKLFSNQGSDLVFGEIEGNSTSFTVKNILIDPENKDIKGGIPLGNMTVSNIAEDADGKFTAEMIKADDIDQLSDEVHIQVSGISVGNIELPIPTDSAFMFYDNFTLNSLDLSVEGHETFAMRDMVLDMDGNADRSEISGEFDIATFSINLEEISDKKSKQILNDMGYLNLEGDAGMKMQWSTDTGLVKISDYFTDVKDVGRLTVDFSMDGYTMEMVKQFGELSKSPDQNTAGIAMMGLMQQLNYIGASIRFEDKSLTNKILDFQAAKQGTDRASIVGLARAIIPFGMAQLNKPEFTKIVASAVGNYLENPKSFEIIANPPEPVPFFEIAATGSTLPQNLIDVLAIDVKANR